jgi:hypothetical protein
LTKGDVLEGEIRTVAAKRPKAVEQDRQSQKEGAFMGGTLMRVGRSIPADVTRSGKSLESVSGIQNDFRKYGFGEAQAEVTAVA